MKLSFVIPVYNEQDSLKQLYSEIIENIKEYEYEIIFVDDGSTDNSYNILQKLTSEDNNVKLIKLRKNFGKSAGLNV